MRGIDRITNPLSRAWQLGFRRSVPLRGSCESCSIRWYLRKGQRATIIHRLWVHGLLPRGL